MIAYFSMCFYYGGGGGQIRAVQGDLVNILQPQVADFAVIKSKPLIHCCALSAVIAIITTVSFLS